MTHTEVASPWETCDHCQAPLDDRQRYCVACGARRAHADDPVARYFVTSARRARSNAVAPPAPPSARPTAGGLRLAIVLALIPLAAAIGVVVGRGSSSEDDLLLQALKAQKAPVVNVTGGGGAGAVEETADSGGGKAKRARKDDDANDADGKVIAETEYGSARQLTGSKVTDAQKAESKKAIEHIVNSKGKEYVEQQRNLPDQIVIP